MERRKFMKSAVLTGGLLATGVAPSLAADKKESKRKKKKDNTPFKLKYAPSIGMFSNMSGFKDPIDNIKFLHELGFRAIFDNGFPNKSKELQGKIMTQLEELGMDLGPFVLYADFSVESMVLKDAKKRQMLVDKVKEGVEIRQRTGAKQALVVPGKYNTKLEWNYQTANVIDTMRELSAVAEEGDLTLVMEPLNAHTNHPGLFLTGVPQAYMICRAVNSPSCKIVNDLYHQQITEGNLIPNIDMAYSEIGAFHVGDNPGRKEPTTGEINYKRIFEHLYKKGYDGTICMEHGKSLRGLEGEEALLAAYREVDSFVIEAK